MALHKMLVMTEVSIASLVDDDGNRMTNNVCLVPGPGLGPGQSMMNDVLDDGADG